MAKACQALTAFADRFKQNASLLSSVRAALRNALRRHLAAPCLTLLGRLGASPHEMEGFRLRAGRRVRPKCFIAATLATKHPTPNQLVEAVLLAMITGYGHAHAVQLARQRASALCLALRALPVDRRDAIDRFLQGLGYEVSDRAHVRATMANRVDRILGCAVLPAEAKPTRSTARTGIDAGRNHLQALTCPDPGDQVGRLRLRRILKQAGLHASPVARATLRNLSRICGPSWRPLFAMTDERLHLIARCLNDPSCYEAALNNTASTVRDRATIELARLVGNRACPFLSSLPAPLAAKLFNELHCKPGVGRRPLNRLLGER
ncbi:MAG: hypothetical protein J7M25_15910 [Deltaproteobacteria bacterium]|nr:hypothetical protein [Deltaproteobacteria bacterium]